MDISLVIPAYNEEEIIEESAKTLCDFFKEEFGDKEYEIIFVNDGSKDETQKKIDSLAEKYSCVRSAGYPENKGKGSAVRVGALAATGDFIIFTDCDLAYGCAIIKEFYNRFLDGDCDLVVGSRKLAAGGYESYTFLRKIMSKVYHVIVSLLTGTDFSDSQCGIKGFSKKAVDMIFPECVVDRFAFDLEILIIASNNSLKIAEMPAKIINHRESRSSINPIRDSLEMLSQIIRIKKIHKKK